MTLVFKLVSTEISLTKTQFLRLLLRILFYLNLLSQKEFGYFINWVHLIQIACIEVYLHHMCEFGQEVYLQEPD